MYLAQGKAGFLRDVYPVGSGGSGPLEAGMKAASMFPETSPAPPHSHFLGQHSHGNPRFVPNTLPVLMAFPEEGLLGIPRVEESKMRLEPDLCTELRKLDLSPGFATHDRALVSVKETRAFVSLRKGEQSLRLSL